MDRSSTEAPWDRLAMVTRLVDRSNWVRIAALCATLALPAGAQAADFTVNTTADTAGSCPTPTTCTLRQAVNDANVAGTDDTIDFNLPPGSVISLVNGPIDINSASSTEKTDISGPGAGALTIRRDPGAPPAKVLILSEGDANVSGVTIRGGLGTAPFDAVGIVIASTTASLTLDGTLVTDNKNDLTGVGPGSGGASAILNIGELLLLNSAVTGNVVDNAGAGASATIVSAGALLTANSTISGNSIDGTSPNDAGAILNVAGLWASVNSTITANVSTGVGGVSNLASAGAANTILAGNTGGAPDCTGAPIQSQGYNLIGNDTGCTFANSAGDQVGTAGGVIDPKLGPLAENGGGTPTHILLARSPALEAGSPLPTADINPPPAPPTPVPCRTTDQRGILRPQSSVCDIGAVEMSAVVPPPAEPPETVIKRKPTRKRPRRSIVRFRSSKPGSTFTCTLDGDDPFPCTNPQNYRGLKRGHHDFTVAATDAAGSTDPTPAGTRFFIRGQMLGSRRGR
ncbi:MAG: fibronectin-binding autotransporter adhesin [Thermoleophilaceae bacterium]|nr:fibronectin-binding autotransporter adhesin [Thermoleophilaceae bacterium]